MNKIYLLVSIFVLSVSCNCQKKAIAQSENINKKAQNEMILEYVANTRGFFKKITIQNNVVSVSRDRNGKDIPQKAAISDKDWNELMSYFEVINLDKMPGLKDPTQKRFYDGAAIANLKVTYNGKEYMTTDFDHGFPPSEIEKIVVKINSFSKEEE